MTRRTKLILGGCLAVVAVLTALVVQSVSSGSSRPNKRFIVPSAAMDPTIRQDATVRVYEGNYRPHRDDVIVFHAPPGQGTQDILTLVKRVIGLPGETIEARGGHVYIDDRPLSEPYLPHATQTDDLPRQVVQAGSYFVMGDNRVASSDSRFFGAIREASIIGQVCACDLHQPT